MSEFPLYPTLPEEAQKEAQELIDGFKETMKKTCETVLSELYVNITPYIESDHWTNYRNEIMDGLQNYGNRKVQGAHDFKKIRQAILREHREEIISDLNHDMVEEIAELKKQIKDMYDRRF